jgi:RHH-type transcriptional regulator, proline utilization regulon repressor / proline dehydrogenase / delta 1-pyrroline-5-carboxylate dehydrogenase
MLGRGVNTRTIVRGNSLLDDMRGRVPAVFDPRSWAGRVLRAAMTDDDFRGRLFRFIDCLPALKTDASLTRHFAEHFCCDGAVPDVLSRDAGRGSSHARRVDTRKTRTAGPRNIARIARAARDEINAMALSFIVGRTAADAVRTLGRLRAAGFAFTLSALGEATVSEAEADEYAARYVSLLANLRRAARRWPALRDSQYTAANCAAVAPGTRRSTDDSTVDDAAAAPGEERHADSCEKNLDWDAAPRVSVSVKPSALYSQADPADFEGSVACILARLKRIYLAVIAAGGSLTIDMEMREEKDLTLEIFRRLRSDRQVRHWPHLAVTLQTYLRATDDDLDALLAWSRREGLPISIRLAKGAYWDNEVAVARQNGWPLPVYASKSDTDAAFERAAEKILREHDHCYLACASHNVRSASAVMEIARALRAPADRCEFQALYGMAGPFCDAVRAAGGRVRLYCPVGDLVPGMAYVMRRLIENTSPDSFLRQAFVEGRDRRQLLAAPGAATQLRAASLRPAENTAANCAAVAPALAAPGERGGTPRPEMAPAPPAIDPATGLCPFSSEPSADFSRSEVREACATALAAIRGQLGRTYPLHIGGRNVRTADRWDSVNPARPAEIVGRVCQAGPREVDRAVAAAARALPAWAATPPRTRAGYLVRAAEVARRRFFELAAWEVTEAGKPWDEACADVAETIDYLEYYAREMIRLGRPRLIGPLPGEVNRTFYRPKGIAAVIAPWNFPLAISGGMAAAAIVAGNCVIYKPSEHSPVTGRLLANLFIEARLPQGVLSFVPGRREIIGDLLVTHPAVALIAFTGSMQVGLKIVEKAGVTRPGQRSVKRVIAEMGGKNAIIIDDDADLDEAVPRIVESAFSYSGQKCSACSRVIVVGGIYDRFLSRLVEAARSLAIGPAEDPATTVGPLISAAAREKVRLYMRIAEREGRILYRSARPPADGFYVPVTIVGGITPRHRLAQEEIFGPVLAVMRAKTFDEAIRWANSTRFALTGGIFSRSPEHLERAVRELVVGNLYLNRGCTGAKVGRQPFGGFRMSGVGSKAGGPDYLLQFMDPQTETENTVRRGFVPFM